MRRTVILVCMVVLAAAGLPAESAVAIDNSYYDWQGVPDAAAFGERYNPYYFSRETAGKRETLTVDRSLYWSRGGTQLREIKALLDGGSLYLFAATQTVLAPEVSIFGYIYVGRKPGETNRYTLELLPSRTKDGGIIVLWSPGGRAVEVGELVNASSSLEGRVDLSRLPADLIAARDQLSVDVTTCYHEAASGTYEEFYFTTLYLADLLALR